MIEPVLLLGHAVLGAAALGTRWVRGQWRRRLLIGIGLLGVVLGVALAVRSGSSDEWRSTTVGGVAVLVGLSAACAWVVALVALVDDGDPLGFALLGVATTGLAMAAVNRWVVPALLFWFCSSLALAGVLRRATGTSPALLVLFASDAALVIALAYGALDAGLWRLSDGLDGWPFYVVVAAGALRAGVLPRTGTWASVARSAGPALPLLAGGGFVLLSYGLGPPDRWAALLLLVWGAAVGAWAIGRRVTSLTVGAAALISLLASCALVIPEALIPAGLAATFATAATALVQTVRGTEASLPLSPLPPSAGFIAVALGFGAAVQQAFGSDRLSDKIPWTIVAALIPVVMATCVGAAARVGAGAARGGRPPPSPARMWSRLVPRNAGAWGTLVLRLVVATSFTVALWPETWLGVDATRWDADVRSAALFGAAMVAALVAGWITTRGRDRTLAAATIAVSLRAAPFPRTGVVARGVSLMAAVLAVGVVGGLTWLTFEGLRVGFLG